MTTSSKKIVRTSLFTAIALVLALVENALPPLLAFAPGAKLGLANVASLLAMFCDGVLSGLTVTVLKSVFVSVFSGNVTALLYSLSAGLVSYTVQAIMVKLLLPRISIVTISIIGAIAHNLTQTLVASLIVQSNLSLLIVYVLPASVIAGVFTGLVTYFTLKHMPDKFLQ